MDKKIIKTIFIALAIILLIGVLISLKNKNNDSNVVENENDIKAINSLITNSNATRNVDAYTFTYKVQGISTADEDCATEKIKIHKYDIIYNLYVKPKGTDSSQEKKLLSSWIVRDFQEICGKNKQKFSTVSKDGIETITSNVSNYISDNKVAPIEKINERLFLVGFKSNGFIYTKVFDVKTGELIFDVPTNNLEEFNKFLIDPPRNSKNEITFSSSKNTLTIKNNKSASFSNKYAILNNSLYYLDTDYTAEKNANGYVKLNIHKVEFNLNVDKDQYVANDRNLTKENDPNENETISDNKITLDTVYAEVKLNGEK